MKNVDVGFAKTNSLKTNTRTMLNPVPGQSSLSRINSRPRISIRVRNERFETWRSTLNRFPKTLLGCQGKRQIYYDELTEEIVFDRSPSAFDSILFYYQSYGILTRPPFIEMTEFVEECIFFELQEYDIQRMKERENYIDENDDDLTAETVHYKDKDLGEAAGLLTEQNQNNRNCIQLCRNRMWKFMDDPASSKWAGYCAIFSFLLIAISVALACLTTLPGIQKNQHPNPLIDTCGRIEFGLNICFGIEYLLRLISAPKFIKFLIAPMNVIDLVAVFPYFIALIVNPKKLASLSFLRMIRMIRVLRLLRLSKQSKQIAAVMQMLRESIKDICTLILCYTITAVVFGSLQYYVEMGAPETPFTSIPQSMWWAFETVIPIGYGDIIPVSIRGKIVGGAVAVFGAVTITVPLLHLGGKYLINQANMSDIPIGKDCQDDE